MVEQLATPGSANLEAPAVPQRFVPGSVATVPVTVTNTTIEAWPADMALSYRWTQVSQNFELLFHTRLDHMMASLGMTVIVTLRLQEGRLPPAE